MVAALSPEELTPEALQSSLLLRFPYLNEVNYQLLSDISSVEKYLEGLKPGQPVVLDLETTGLNPKKHHIVGVALAYAEREAVYIPVAHTVGMEHNVPWEPLRDILNRLFADPEDWHGAVVHPMIPYNWKFEGNFLGAAGVHVHEWRDCMVSAYLNDSNKKAGLKGQTRFLFGVDQVDFGDCFPEVKKKDWNFAAVHPEVAYLYACGDVDWTFRIWVKTAPAREEQALIFKVENKLTDVLRRMEQNGFYFNLPYFLALNGELERRIEIVQERIYRVTGRTITKITKKSRVKRDPETDKPIKDPDTGKSIKETVEEEVVAEFKIDSQQQVGRKLFSSIEEGGLGIPNPHRTETGKMATSVSVIEAMKDEHPIVADILLYRKLKKCQNTYIKHLIEDCDEECVGKFSFLQCHAPTGRLAASKGGPDSGYVGMNVQSVPAAVPLFRKGWIFKKWEPLGGDGPDKEYPCSHAFPTNYLDAEPVYFCPKKDCARAQAEGFEVEWQEKIKYWEIPNVRKGFIGRPGYVVVAIDYSGIELRIAANLSKEPAWVNEYQKPDPDLHRATAIAIYGEDVVNSPDYKQKRGASKTINFATLYGGSGGAIARQIEGMTYEEGQALIEQFFAGLPVLSAWINGMHAFGRKNHYVRTFFKRKRPLHMYEDDDPVTKRKSHSFGDRSTVSTAVQGTAADVMKIAMVRVDSAIQKRGWQEDARMLLTVHDECVFEVKADKLQEIVPVLVENMAFHVEGWPVPLVCDIEIGPSWGEGEEYRLIDGHLILHSDLTKALEEGRDITADLPPLKIQATPEPEPVSKTPLIPLGSIPESDGRVTLHYRSLRTRTNMEKFRTLINRCPGSTSLVILFTGEQAKFSVEETVDVVSLLKSCSEEGLSVSVEP